MKALEDLIKEHLESNDDLILGQRFIVFYHGGQWPELFYKKNDLQSLMLIHRWLTDNQYEDSLPERKDV